MSKEMINLLPEKIELDKKITKLVEFLNDIETSDSEHAITASDSALLHLQLKHMKRYACCLNLRMSN